MARIRNEKRWKVPFAHHPNPAAFLEHPRTDGAHAVHVGRQIVDLLIQDKGHRTTLVVFSGRLSLDAKFTPQFSGLGIAKDVGVNLISVADPAMNQGEITVAWYMGDRHTGPLRSVLSPLIQHVLDSLETKRTILFGGSGGGFAAANYAHDFPGCIAFIFNPRLTLLRHAKGPVSVYLRECHEVRSDGSVGKIERKTLERFGPLEAYEYAQNGLNHDLLIYQNLLDSDFLGTQVLPYVERVKDDPKLRLNFSMDELGHTAIPGDSVRSILRALSTAESHADGAEAAGFLTPSAAVWHALRSTPPIAARLKTSTAKSQTQSAEISVLKKKLVDREEELNKDLEEERRTRRTLQQSLEHHLSQNENLQNRLQSFESVSRYIPKFIKRLLKSAVGDRADRSG